MRRKQECLLCLCLCLYLWHLSSLHADYCVQKAHGGKKSLNPSKLENFHIDIYIASDSGVEIIDSNGKKCGNTVNPNDWYFAGCTFWITIFSLIGL